MLQTISNGRPRDEQVRKLTDYFHAHAKPGVIIDHPTIEKLIGETRARSVSRYYGILTGAKRKFFRESNGLWIKVENGIGCRVLEGREQMEFGSEGVRQSVRKMARSVSVIGAVADDRLDENGRKVRDRTMENASALLQFNKLEEKKLVLTLNSTQRMD